MQKTQQMVCLVVLLVFMVTSCMARSMQVQAIDRNELQHFNKTSSNIISPALNGCCGTTTYPTCTGSYPVCCYCISDTVACCTTTVDACLAGARC